MKKRREIPGIHGTIYEEAKESGVELLYLVESIGSDKINYHVDVFKCEDGYAVFEYRPNIHILSGVYSTLEEAIEEAKKSVNFYESLMLK